MIDVKGRPRHIVKNLIAVRTQALKELPHYLFAIDALPKCA